MAGPHETVQEAQGGRRVGLGPGTGGDLVAKEDEGKGLVDFHSEAPFLEVLERVGQVPYRPISPGSLRTGIGKGTRRSHAQRLGSAAAPPAGLHFTPQLLETLRAQGVGTAFLTLHIGLGTFRPVQTERIEDHRMHSEFFQVDESCAQAIARAKEEGGRVIAVGTTVVRALEATAKILGEVKAYSGWTDIFIYPGFEFQVIDGLITNFHLPCSTLLMLVCAFGGHQRILEAYRVAVREKYAFYSYGDGMLII